MVHAEIRRRFGAREMEDDSWDVLIKVWGKKDNY